MKYNNKVISLTSVLLGLIVLYILGITFSNRIPGKGDHQGLLLPGFSEEDVAGFTISGEEEEFLFTKSDEGSWFVSLGLSGHEETSYDTGALYPGNEGRIKAFLGILMEAPRTAVVTKDSEKHPLFEVDRERASVVTLWGPGEKSILYLGKSDPTNMGEYVRIEGEDEVFITTPLGSYLSRDLVYWSKLTLFPDRLKEKDIISLSFREYVAERGAYDEYRLLKTGEGNDSWVVQGVNTKPDPVSIERLLRNLVQVKGKGFSRSMPEGPVQFEITVATLDGTEYILEGRQAGEEVFLILRGSEQPLYLLDLEVFRNIMVAKETLFG
ncbi:MAG: DUF4340 domain-containing protein [Spirochaetales bacterium]|nr:DUF4340 domain-containing protein [Spirochaetales bacterium]